MHKSQARQLIERAYQAWDAEEWLRAAELFEQVLAHFPDEKPSAEWWYDAALARKFLRNWQKAYELGREAAARAPRGEGEPAFWNLGIAATIQREWATARDAWAGFGIELPDGEGEIDARFGNACVRLDTGGLQEVVWIERLCPTRGRVVNVPVTGGRRYGEIVVHDGVPNGERIVDGTICLRRVPRAPGGVVEGSFTTADCGGWSRSSPRPWGVVVALHETTHRRRVRTPGGVPGRSLRSPRRARRGGCWSSGPGRP
ncbi:hypothetical protein QF037_006593 [Streptomyces canus]|uniref:tetratricopeptide repeat protein n=1 Tax=Streptomyces canus TaxID=58343 RepID=UPI002784E918|nr:tetratricopeptide repeat protein [Streptomyces canus]MDQ0602248.1 hypothetical protein [Streptomyces canus]